MFNKLTKDNIMIYAIKHYHNPSCEGINEFYDDMKRFKYIKRLFRKYQDSGVLKERLLLNHIIVLDNLFGAEAASTLLFFKIEMVMDIGIKEKILMYILYMMKPIIGL